MKFISVFTRLALVALALSIFASAQKLTLDEVIAKHLDSIMPAASRAKVQNRFSLGVSSFESKLPSAKGGGKALVVSDARDLMFLLSLNSKEYQFEKIGYFRGDTSLPFVTAGKRSPLGAFVNDHQRVLTEGLFMGSISSRWVLADPRHGGGKLNLAGIKKVGDRKAYCIEYFPGDGGSSEFKIRIYIDAETFQHIKTEYHHEILPRMEEMKKGLGAMAGGTANSAGVTLEMDEEFSDFKNVNGVTLPYGYRIKYLSSSNQGTYNFEWGITFQQHLFNQNLAPDFFTFDVK